MARQNKATEETTATPKGEKEYVFFHPNKYLTVGTLGVQFIDNKFATTDRELAEKLINIEDIQLISQE